MISIGGKTILDLSLHLDAEAHMGLLLEDVMAQSIAAAAWAQNSFWIEAHMMLLVAATAPRAI
jgi:hypothetical protein